jgi:enoyl-CoA hydratase
LVSTKAVTDATLLGSVRAALVSAPMVDDLGASGLRFERDGVIGWCIIDRPEARNAFTPGMYFGIRRAVSLVNADPDLAAMIITGTGDVFSSGGDLGGRSEPGDVPVPDIGPDILPFVTIRDSRAPVVAAVNGICQAGGLLVAMVADIAVASDRATFRAPELLRGIVDATYAAILPAHVGIAVARDLLLSARRFDAEEAVRLGVISRMAPHDQLREAAVEAVGEILQTGPLARMHVKRMLNDRYGLIDYQTMFGSLADSSEPREGMQSFMEKRAPSWVPEQFSAKPKRK